eukprot:CAMPEP_0194377740 /NCGR_PEP_ID=MMETSP0174-20130528/32256_1 /TAXON_ID=216777 /ORGANISM="Proboscia alata, Strain PI-D3" /LENGTH=395 /DNA_ID=CAMNT_0039159295 /DNA_START=87 /DNA_END=1274 /DNA_ORIENTATION=+
MSAMNQTQQILLPRFADPNFRRCAQTIIGSGMSAVPSQDLSQPSNTVSHRNQPVAEFLYQLTRMLSEQFNSHIIRWINGRIEVYHPHRLESEILKQYFRHSKFASFQRQLNYFGFRKLAGKGKMSPCSYVNNDTTHELQSLLSIKRKTHGLGLGRGGRRNVATDANLTPCIPYQNGFPTIDISNNKRGLEEQQSTPTRDIKKGRGGAYHFNDSPQSTAMHLGPNSNIPIQESFMLPNKTHLTTIGSNYVSLSTLDGGERSSSSLLSSDYLPMETSTGGSGLATAAMFNSTWADSTMNSPNQDFLVDDVQSFDLSSNFPTVEKPCGQQYFETTTPAAASVKDSTNSLSMFDFPSDNALVSKLNPSMTYLGVNSSLVDLAMLPTTCNTDVPQYLIGL